MNIIELRAIREALIPTMMSCAMKRCHMLLMKYHLGILRAGTTITSITKNKAGSMATSTEMTLITLSMNEEVVTALFLL
jgi:hypothetical protein